MRLDAFLSHNGFGSRKNVHALLHEGRVRVNGKPAIFKNAHVDEKRDEVFVDGAEVENVSNVFLMMNKASGFVCDKKSRDNESVFECLPEKYQTPFFEKNLHAVGRLDKDTEGLLLFTTNGKLSHALTSPKSNVEKKYLVRLQKAVSRDEKTRYKQSVENGIEILREGKEAAFVSKPAKIFFVNDNECEIILREGKFHEVKRMFLALGNEVVFLKRLSIACLSLDENLASGEVRELTNEEVAKLGFSYT